MRLRKNTIAMAAAACTLLITDAAKGAVIVNFTQVGSDVVLDCSGTLITTGLNATPMGPSWLNSEFTGTPATFMISAGSAGQSAVMYSGGGMTGLAVFGTLSDSIDTALSGGDLFAFSTSGLLFLSDTHSSGGSISSQTTWRNRTLYGGTFIGLGLVAGSYVTSWGSGADADTLTVNVGAVPEPSTTCLFGLAAVLGLCGRRRSRP